MRPINLLLVLFSLSFFWTNAQEGHNIEIQIDGFDKDSLFLGYYLYDKQYLLDTAVVNAEGKFIFQGDEALDPGLYLVVLPPMSDFFQLIINPGEQDFKVQTKRSNLNGSIKFEGSQDNELLYQYVNTIANLRPTADSISNLIKGLEDGDPEKQRLQNEIQQMNNNVIGLQNRIINDHPETLTSQVIKINKNVDIPDFTGTPDEIRNKQYLYMRDHYFDYIDLKDDRLLRTPFLFEKIEFFVKKYHIQHPDTISQALDRVLLKMNEGSTLFKFYLSHYLNEFAASKLVGMDAVYVHLVENYYDKGKAPWTEEDQLKKIVDNAKKLKPLLIGKKAPNFLAYTKAEKAINLYDVDAEYTVLYFWRYDCGHCKKSTPIMKEFYENYKEKGVKIFAVCVKFTDEVPPCWEYIEDNEIAEWIHVVDPYLLSKFTTTYDINSTPQIYILDKNKEIVSKKIGAEQLGEVIDRIIEIKELEKQEGRR